MHAVWYALSYLHGVGMAADVELLVALLLFCLPGKNPSMFVTQTDVDRILEEGKRNALRSVSVPSGLPRCFAQAVLVLIRCAISRICLATTNRTLLSSCLIGSLTLAFVLSYASLNDLIHAVRAVHGTKRQRAVEKKETKRKQSPEGANLSVPPR
jgi:hypothetical protein